MQLDAVPVLERHHGRDRPVAATVPRLVAVPEALVHRARRTLASPHAAEPRVQRRVPRRLAGLVRAVDDVQSRRQGQGVVVERPEGVRANRFEPHRSERFQVRPAFERPQTGRQHTPRVVFRQTGRQHIPHELAPHRLLPADLLDVVACVQRAEADLCRIERTEQCLTPDPSPAGRRRDAARPPRSAARRRAGRPPRGSGGCGPPAARRTR